jgi:hypothetical protein
MWDKMSEVQRERIAEQGEVVSSTTKALIIQSTDRSSRVSGIKCHGYPLILKNLDGREPDGTLSALVERAVFMPPQLHAEGTGSELACKQIAQLLNQFPDLKDQKKQMDKVDASMTRADEYYKTGDLCKGFVERQKTLESCVLDTVPALETHELSNGKIKLCLAGSRSLFFLIRMFRSYAVDATHPKTLFRAFSLGFVARFAMRLQREWYGSQLNGVPMPSLQGIKVVELCVILPAFQASQGEILPYSEQAMEGSFTDLELVTAQANTTSNMLSIKKQRSLNEAAKREKVPTSMRSHSSKRGAHIRIKHDSFGSCFLRAVSLQRGSGKRPNPEVRLFWFNLLCFLRQLNRYRGSRNLGEDKTQLCSACSRSPSSTN